MSRIAIFLDGGYLDKLSDEEFGVRVDFSKLVARILSTVQSKTPDQLDLLRTLYYHCLPYQSNPPSLEESTRFSRKRSFFAALSALPRFEVRMGRLAFCGVDNKGKKIFQQKRTDLLLGLDFALLSGKRQITHTAVLAGDSDLLPAFKVAKDEGVLVWLFHGPKVSKKDGDSTFAQELWQTADERCEIDMAFMQSIRR
jgi:uncharacterized LabA/DUF88 family protein